MNGKAAHRSSTKPILHTSGPTQSFQQKKVPPRADYSTSVVLHEAMYNDGNRSNMRQFCTRFDTARRDSAQASVQITRFHTFPIQHNNPGPAPSFPVSTHDNTSGR